MSHHKNMNALAHRTRLHLCLLPLALTASLAACGGGNDDGGADNPPVAATNLSACFNPSMYTVGSSWSVTSAVTSTSPAATSGAARTTTVYDSQDTVYVLAPPARWAMEAGTVRWAPTNATDDTSSVLGTYKRVANGLVRTSLSAQFQHFSANDAIRYQVYEPALSEPVALGPNETYRSPTSQSTSAMLSIVFNANGIPVVPNPPRSGEGSQQVNTTTQLTYVGRESVTVPAGQFETCHVITGEAGVGQQAWRVADGPYKGLTVKTQGLTTDGATYVAEAKAISATWK